MANSPLSTYGSETIAAAENAVDRATQGAHDMVDRVAEKAGPAVDRASEALQSGVDDLNEMQERWMEASRACVRDHPLVSVGVAVAAGMLLSRLMAR